MARKELCLQLSRLDYWHVRCTC